MQHLIDRVKMRCEERNAVILSHTYQPPEIQDLADFVGDSYGLSKKATEIDAEVIVFCGVQFMAETAAALNPGRIVLHPVPTAGCPMADMITGEQLRALKAKHPGVPVVCYVNSPAEAKAESTVCCTSSNAAKVVRWLGADEVIFVPDRFLGKFVERQLGTRMIYWEGHCPIHAALDAPTVRAMREAYPHAELMVHPECIPEVQDLADHVLSTGQMAELVQETACRQFLVGTELGILHHLRKLAPDTEFVPVSPFLRCPDMKKIGVHEVLRSLDTLSPRAVLSEEIAEGSRRAIEKMIEATESDA